jgi:hypothetical protein
VSSTHDTQGGTATAGPEGAGQPSEAELRAAYEAELSRITSAEMVLQATVSLLNIGARRLGLMSAADPGDAGENGPGQPDPERDLEQVRDAIDAVRGLLPIVERRAPEQARALRDALSQLQMAYARETTAAPAPAAAPPEQGAPAAQGAPSTQGQPTAPGAQPPPPGTRPGADQRRPGPAESTGRLWVPGR